MKGQKVDQVNGLVQVLMSSKLGYVDISTPVF